MKSVFKAAILLAGAVALSACTVQKGRNFSSEKAAAIVPGKTSKREVLAIMGEPLSAQTNTYRKDGAQKELANPAVIQRLEYYYSERNGSENAIQEKILPNRLLDVFVMNDTVVGVRRSSSFSADSTSFDHAKSSGLKKGQTTQQEVLAMLGAPSGKSVYPMSYVPGGETWFYAQTIINLANGANEFKRLSISFSEDKRVADFTVGVDSENRPVAPAPVVIPVVIPARK